VRGVERHAAGEAQLVVEEMELLPKEGRLARQHVPSELNLPYEGGRDHHISSRAA
jgi:hypothetical protein